MGLDTILFVMFDTVKKLWIILHFSVMAAYMGPKSGFPKVEFGLIFLQHPETLMNQKNTKLAFYWKCPG